MVVRGFEAVQQAMEFVNNPSNQHLNPEYVDPDTVHREETQEHVNRVRQAQNTPKKKGLIDAPVGSPNYMEAPDEQQNAADII